MSNQMTDEELLAWLAEHGTEISQDELQGNFQRVRAASESAEATGGPDPAELKPRTSGSASQPRVLVSFAAQEFRDTLEGCLRALRAACVVVAPEPADFVTLCWSDRSTVDVVPLFVRASPVVLACHDVHVAASAMCSAPRTDENWRCLPAETDESLLTMTSAGSFQPLKELVRRHGPRAFKTAAHYAGDLEVATAVVRDAFAVAISTAHGTQYSHGTFQGWLLSAVVKRGREEWGRRSCAVTILIAFECQALTRAIGRCPKDNVGRSQLAAAVERLNESVREVVYLWDTGFHDTEIAEVLCKPVGAVKRAQSDAIVELQRLLERDLG